VNNLKLFTSESVSEGHPDKLCDQISDAILDAILSQDSHARVACETFATKEYIVVGGEVRTSAKVNYEKIIRDTIRNVGYTDARIGIGADTCEIDVRLHEQSSDIAIGVDSNESQNKSIGAGDQGIMFGFATNETEQLMPLPIMIAHKLVQKASQMRKSGEFKYARPDMKTQVTIDYSDVKNPRVHTVLMSIQHDPGINIEEFKKFVTKMIVEKVLNEFKVDTTSYKLYLNPTGRFVVGGPDGDAGLTGRKIIVDTYGGYARHGGGAFSGKDATKVDRSAAYAARYVAKNIVASNLCDKCEIQLSFAIGMSQPISIAIDTFNTAKISEDDILTIIKSVFDLSAEGIINGLDLMRPIYAQTSVYGHMGRTDLDVPWEKIDKVKQIISLSNKLN
jgi:S-adenosylmethionine synthetase